MSVSFSDALTSGTGKGVKVGILDTGVVALPALDGCVAGHYQISDEDRQIKVNQRDHGIDDLNHGTACADIIHRYAPDAELFDVKVMDFKAANSKYKIAAGIRFGVEQGWDILNVCVGTQLEFDRLRQVCRNAETKGVIILSAVDSDADSIGYPAGYPEVISVDYDCLDSPLAYSFNSDADICGHGVYVEANNSAGETESFSGSSFACPHITALLARVRQYFPELTSTGFLRKLKLSKQLVPPF